MKPNKKKNQRPENQRREKKIGVMEAQQLFQIKCRVCGKKTEVHAYGKNKRTMADLKTTHPVISSACWNNACTNYGKEVYTIDTKG